MMRPPSTGADVEEREVYRGSGGTTPRGSRVLPDLPTSLRSSPQPPSTPRPPSARPLSGSGRPSSALKPRHRPTTPRRLSSLPQRPESAGVLSPQNLPKTVGLSGTRGKGSPAELEALEQTLTTAAWDLIGEVIPNSTVFMYFVT